MKTRTHTRLLLSSALAAAIVSGSAHSQSVKLMDYFYPIQEGAAWTYQWSEGAEGASEQLTLVNTDWNVTLFTGKNSPEPYSEKVLRFRFERQYDRGGKDVWYDYFGNGASFSRFGSDDGGDKIRVDGGLAFPFTVSVGSSYATMGDLYIAGEFQGAVTYSLEVMDQLAVTVEAGKFPDCVHLEFRMKQGDEVIWTEDTWWAKGMGIIKESRTEDGKTSTRELVSSTIMTGGEISVQQPKGTELVDGSSRINMGRSSVGKMKRAKLFTVRNTGTTELNGLAIRKGGAHAGDFIVKALKKKVLAPGKATTFKAKFKPSARGRRSAVIQIESSDADENPFVIEIIGKGVK